MRFFNLFTPARTEIVNKKSAKTIYYSRSAENGADKVLSRGEENSSVHMTYVNFLKPRKSALDVTLYAASSGRSFLRRVLQIRRDFLTTCTQKSIQGKKSQVDVALCGRSMVEMLGVLAIVGVLSVGAIAGYSKAMMKYKLNKQTEQLNTLLTVMTRYKNEWKGIQEYIFLTPYFIKMGEIPENMIKENSDYLYDVFGNQIALRNNSDPAWNKVKINYYISNKESFELCQNVMQTAQNFRYELYKAGVYAYAGESSFGGSEYLSGDLYCKSSGKCLKDLSLNDIYRLCQVCEEENQTCLFQFLWMIE